MPQAKEKGRWELPPDRGLVNSLHPHNMGSFLAYITTSLGPLFTPSFLPQHQIIDAIRLYFAYQGAQVQDSADLYYDNVTSMLSIMKTSVFLVETVVSDLFIVRLKSPLLAKRLAESGSPHLVISVLYRLECELPDHGSSSPSVPCRHRYVPRMGSQRRSTHSTRLPAMGIAAVYTLSLIGTNTVFNNEQQRISNSFFSCTLALNTVCTGTCLRLSSDVFSFLTGLQQVSLRSASGERSVRPAMPRWAPTSLTSPSSSLNLVRTFYSSASFSLRLQRSHMYPDCNRCDLSLCISIGGRDFCRPLVPLQHLLGYGESCQPLPCSIPADMLLRRPRL